jgi:tetratricopeptide (TPR) repeat protein
MNDRYFKAWLREYGKRLRKLPEADHQLASQLVRLSQVGCGELGEIAAEIGRDLLMKPAGKGEEVAAVEPRKRVSAETSPPDSISSIENSDSDQAKAWLNRGCQQWLDGDFLGAIASFDKALQFKPDFHEAWLYRGGALCGLEEYEEAIANYDKALQFKPDFHDAWYNRGLALAYLVKHEEAIANYDKALQIKPDYHEAWFNLGVALADLGENEKAITSYDKAIQIKPDYHEAYKNKGLALYNLGKYELAITSYKQAIQIKSDYYEAWYNRGHALAKFGENKQALESFEQVIKIQPDFHEHEAWNYRGVILNTLGQYEDAIASFDQAIQIKPNNHKAWLNRGDSVRSSRPYNPAAATVLQLKLPNVSPILLNSNLTQRGYQGELSSYQEGLKHCPQDTEAKEWRNQGLKVFQRLLNSQKSAFQKRQLLAKFLPFSQIGVDVLVEEGESILALETAEMNKNLYLTWILDARKETTLSPKYRQIQSLTNPTTAIVYWHLSPNALTTFIIKHNSENPIIIDAPLPASGEFKRIKSLEDWIGTWDEYYQDYRKNSPQPPFDTAGELEKPNPPAPFPPQGVFIFKKYTTIKAKYLLIKTVFLP